MMRLGTRYLAVVAGAFIAAASLNTTASEVADGNLFALVGLIVSWLFAGWIVVTALRSIRELRSQSPS